MLHLVGSYGSPYTRKIRAVLRYRQIPFQFRVTGPNDPSVPPIPVKIIPILIYPGPENSDGEAMVDSTPMIRRLEGEHQGREVLPSDPAMTFIDALLEDYGDEWVTKMMFHYRWAFDPDIEKAGKVLPRYRNPGMGKEEAQHFYDLFTRRQIDRLWVVGSNEVTAPVIEESYRRLLGILDRMYPDQPFLMGSRPGASDFAFHGQLTQLAHFDPTSQKVCLDVAPSVYAWVHKMDDLGSLEPTEDDWVSREAFPGILRELLAEVGSTYVPFLLANAKALQDGLDLVECEVKGAVWEQRPFPYQGKCLRWLREAYDALRPGDREAVDGILKGTGCEALFPR